MTDKRKKKGVVAARGDTAPAGEAPAADKPKRQRVDWEAIEPVWRAGIESKQSISQRFGVSRAALDKHFEKLGIERNLADKIRGRADDLVALDAVVTPEEVAPEVTPQAVAVTEGVTSEENGPKPSSAKASAKVTEQDIVEANAKMQAQVRREHRKDISRYRNLCNKLLQELEHQTDCQDLYDQLADLMYAPDKNGFDKLNEIYRKIIAMPQRVESMKKLAETLKTLVGLEREAFGIAAVEEGKTPYTGQAMSASESYMRLIAING